MNKLGPIRSIILATLLGLISSHQLCAQYYYGGQMGGQDPMAQVQQIVNSYGDPMAQVQQIMNNIDADQRRLQTQMQQTERVIIKNFRAMTGDYQSPNHVILHRADQLARRQNPQLYRQMEKNHRRNMADIKAFGDHSSRMSKIYSEIGDIRHQGFQNRMAMMDRSNERFIDNVIWEQSNYSSPTTGESWKIGWDQPNQLHQSGSDVFYTDSNHNQFRQTTSGLWEQLDEGY